MTPYPANVVIEYRPELFPATSASFIRTPRPKSASLNSPEDARRQLSGLTSLCTTLAACTSATAATIAAAASTRSFGFKLATSPSGALESHCDSDSPHRSIAVNTASSPSRCTPYKKVTRLLFWFRNLLKKTTSVKLPMRK